MALTESTMMPLGTKAPNFHIKDVMTDRYMTLEDVKSPVATVFYFICNHCPYVIHVNTELVQIANDYRHKGVSFVGVSSNDVTKSPEDGPEMMRIVGKVLKYPFPYLYDKHQEMAKAYDAACTPDIYLFDGEASLYYRGRIDGSSPGNGVTLDGNDLRAALDGLLSGKPSPESQLPSMGCNIKWK